MSMWKDAKEEARCKEDKWWNDGYKAGVTDGYEQGKADARFYILHCGDEMPLTNGDRVRAMTDGELADWIARIITYHTIEDECNINCPLYKCCNDQQHDNIEDWLKSPWEAQE